MDIGFIIVAATFLGRKGLLDKPLTSAAERDALAHEVFAVMGNALVWFYLGAGIWKMNYGFLDTQGSCAPIYILQLVDAYLPDALLPPMAIIQFINDTAPLVVIIVEAGIGVLMHYPGRLRIYGVALGVLLHGLIAITPGPNNAGGFGVMLLARYYSFVPDAMAQTLSELREAVLGGGSALVYAGMGVVLAVSIPGLLRSADHTFFIDWSIPIYAVQTLLFARALVLETRGAEGRGAEGGGAKGGDGHRGAALQAIVRTGFATWMVIYTFGLPILGLQDMGNVHMFASLRLHGGSNHLLLPTGLLQQWRHDGAPESPWSGGVVRVEYSTSTHMTNLYPAEVTHILTPRVRELLRASGHTGRQWFPLKTRIFGPAPHPTELVGPPLAYTIPALELRRLIKEARARGETQYTLVYTRLPRGRLDVNSSRAPSGGPTITFRVDKDGKESCVQGGMPWLPLPLSLVGSTPCEPTELPLLPEPGLWPLKFLLFYPVPLLPETAGPSAEMPCVDP